MPNLQRIKHRIATVRSTQKITRAMRMVAAAKVRRAQESIAKMRPFARRMRSLTNSLAARAEPGSHPLLQPGTGSAVLLVVVTSDRGLCGGFNANIVNETMRILRERFPGQQSEIIVAGRRGVEILRRRPCIIRSTHVDVFDAFSIAAARRIGDEVVNAFVEGFAREVYCIYNEFKSAIAQRVTVERLLPYELGDDTGIEDLSNYLFEPNEHAILFALIQRNIQVQLWRILQESAAAEHGARMAAMESATKNASSIIAALTLKYNRARQDAITKEVVEVITGAQNV